MKEEISQSADIQAIQWDGTLESYKQIIQELGVDAMFHCGGMKKAGGVYEFATYLMVNCDDEELPLMAVASDWIVVDPAMGVRRLSEIRFHSEYVPPLS